MKTQGFASLQLFIVAICCTTLLYCNKPGEEAPPEPPPPPPVGSTLTITSISPAIGAVNAVITVKGAGFSTTASENSFYFNGVKATVISANTSQMLVQVPTGATTGPVSLTVNNATATGPLFTVQAPPPPAADSVTVSTYIGTFSHNAINGPVATATFRMPWHMVTDGAGNIIVADGADNSIRKISTTGIVSTVAGGGGASSSVEAGIHFYNPEGVAVDANGVIYVADTYNNRIRKISNSGTVTTLAGSGQNGYIDGIGTNAYFWEPAALTVDKAGNVFVVDEYIDAIRKITPEGVVTTFAGGLPGYNDGVGKEARFYGPEGITIDGDNNLYVADMGNNMIRKITPAGVVSTVAGRVGGGTQDGQGTSAGIGHPWGITIDKKGNIYFTEYSGSRVRMITPGGWVSTLAGVEGEEGYKDGPGHQALFNGPAGITVDKDGVIYVAEQGLKKIRKLVIKK